MGRWQSVDSFDTTFSPYAKSRGGEKGRREPSCKNCCGSLELALQGRPRMWGGGGARGPGEDAGDGRGPLKPLPLPLPPGSALRLAPGGSGGGGRDRCSDREAPAAASPRSPPAAPQVAAPRAPAPRSGVSELSCKVAEPTPPPPRPRPLEEAEAGKEEPEQKAAETQCRATPAAAGRVRL